jgi:LPXTG-motif cell wall-anchored protein
MKRTSTVATAITVSALTVWASSGTAWSDELTTMTAIANPSVIQPGDTVDISITVTNTHDRKITYTPIEAPEEFSGCAQDVGTLMPGQTATVSCQGVVSNAELAVTFRIANAETEHNETTAEATAHISLAPPTEPPTTEPSSTPPATEPGSTSPATSELPTTGSSIGPIAAVGGGLILLGLAFGFWRWRANRG